MKTRIVIGISLGFAMSCSAWAEGPPDPAALGSIDAMLASCLQVNPAGKAVYDSLRAAMIGEQADGAVEALAQTPEYRQAYEAAHQKAAAEPRDVALKGCTNLVAALGPQVHKSGKHK
jgi:F0F1-type ATP synthase membrane subunit c/vacuolar-type H+-ATPase subunit K